MSNKKHLMISRAFKFMLFNWDSQLRSSGREILLIIDNCSSHVFITTELIQIKPVFFSVNCTSVLQPMDARVIKTFNHNYRKKLISKRIHFYDTYVEGKFNVTILDALGFTNKSWDLVNEQTIINCFINAGFHSGKLIEVKDDLKGNNADKVAKFYFGDEFNYYDHNFNEYEMIFEDLENEPEKTKSEEDSEMCETLPKVDITTALTNFKFVTKYYKMLKILLVYYLY